MVDAFRPRAAVSAPTRACFKCEQSQWATGALIVREVRVHVSVRAPGVPHNRAHRVARLDPRPSLPPLRTASNRAVRPCPVEDATDDLRRQAYPRCAAGRHSRREIQRLAEIALAPERRA
jgi:hypothetical protein